MREVIKHVGAKYKLNDSDIDEVLQLLSTGFSYHDIANHFQVQEIMIKKIYAGQDRFRTLLGTKKFILMRQERAKNLRNEFSNKISTNKANPSDELEEKFLKEIKKTHDHIILSDLLHIPKKKIVQLFKKFNIKTKEKNSIKHLSRGEVFEIVEQLKSNVSLAEIALNYNVSGSTIYRILNGYGKYKYLWDDLNFLKMVTERENTYTKSCKPSKNKAINLLKKGQYNTIQIFEKENEAAEKEAAEKEAAEKEAAEKELFLKTVQKTHDITILSDVLHLPSIKVRKLFSKYNIAPKSGRKKRTTIIKQTAHEIVKHLKNEVPLHEIAFKFDVSGKIVEKIMRGLLNFEYLWNDITFLEMIVTREKSYIIPTFKMKMKAKDKLKQLDITVEKMETVEKVETVEKAPENLINIIKKNNIVYWNRLLKKYDHKSLNNDLYTSAMLREVVDFNNEEFFEYLKNLEELRKELIKD